MKNCNHMFTSKDVCEVCGMKVTECYAHLLEVRDILKAILDDATGDADNPNKRMWPIRAANHRTAKKLLAGHRISEIDDGGWIRE